MPNLRAQTLARAADIVGGLDQLAGQLGIAPAALATLIRGEAEVPPAMFLRATEIITEAGLTDVAKRAASEKHEAGKDSS